MTGLAGQTGFYTGDGQIRTGFTGQCLVAALLDPTWQRIRIIVECILKANEKGPGGRKLYDRILPFRIIDVQALHKL